MIENRFEYYWQDILAEEFKAPSDPESDKYPRTLGRALIDAKRFGVKTGRERANERTQALEWAPLNCIVPFAPFDPFARSVKFKVPEDITLSEETCNQLIVGIYQPDDVDRVEIVAATGNMSGNVNKQQVFEVGDYLSLHYTRHTLHETFTVPFFNQFEGWTCGEDGLWVPPSPEAQEPADAS